MKKKLLILILILCIALGGVGYAYYITRDNMSNKELFMYYLTRKEETNEKVEKIKQYNKKKIESSYKTKGKVELNVSGEEDDESIQMLNNSKITFEGKINPTEKMIEQEITAVLGMGINVPFNYKQDKDYFGVQTNLLTPKYIAIRNDNLKELAKRFDADSEEFPDKINFENNIDYEKINDFAEKYKRIIYENLPAENAFTKSKDGNKTTLSVSMTNKEIATSLKTILEELKNDEFIINILKNSNVNVNEYYDSINGIIEELNNLADENGKAEVKLYIENKKLVGLDILFYDENDIVVKIVTEIKDNNINLKMNLADGAYLDFNYEVKYDEKDLSMNFYLKIADDEIDYKIKGNAEYKNIFELDNVEEKYTLELSGKMEQIENIVINFSNLVTFDDNIEIEKISENNSYIINDMTDEQLQNFIMLIYQKFLTMK